VTGGVVDDVHYILAGGAAVAVFRSRNDSVTRTLYLHRDHLGSVTHVTDQSGAVVDTQAYDAWGAARNPSDWTDYTATPPPPELRRPQYTGHEALHDVGIVHMNGRIYDPKLGRVLSADPYVQFPGAGQSYNRYSYVLNNPLRYTDPSGFCLPVYNSPWSHCNHPLAGSGLLGHATSRPRIGISQTIHYGDGYAPAGGLNVLVAVSSGGSCAGKPGWVCEKLGEGGSGIGLAFDFAFGTQSSSGPQIWYTSYAGIIADPAGVSSGGAAATATLAAAEARVVAPSVSPMLSAPGNPSQALPAGPVSALGESLLRAGQDYLAEQCTWRVACGAVYATGTALYEVFVSDALEGVDDFLDGNYRGAVMAGVVAVFKPAKVLKEFKKLEKWAPLSGKLNRPNVTDPDLIEAMDNLWRRQDLRPGGTIGELLREAQAGGELVHLEKAKGRLAQLTNRVNDFSAPLSRSDRAAAERVINDLKDAIRAAEGR
jgi:RHS repeat-associated protein